MAAGPHFTRQKFAANRPNDFIYDPNFTFSGPKDYYKAAVNAAMSTAQFAVCPIFQTMFSDVPQYPRQRYIMRRIDNVPHYKNRGWEARKGLLLTCFSRPLDVVGTDRYLFFKRPEILSYPENVFIPSLGDESLQTEPPQKQSETASKEMKSRKIQTMYRESSAQTHPWQSSKYTVIDKSDPELLKLEFLKWGCGLPAGMHEIKLIERARIKREWEKMLPPIDGPENLEKNRKIIETLEQNEWAFREQEIQDLHELRMELLERMLSEIHEKSNIRTAKKLRIITERKTKEKERKIAKIRHKTERELRKLEMKHKGIATKYSKTDIITQYADRKSETYGPLMRHGVHPKRGHEIIKMEGYRAQLLGVENLNTKPRWLKTANCIKDGFVKLPGTRICIRKTRWTDPVLKKLHEELKNIRVVPKLRCKLRIRVPEEVPEPKTPQLEGIDDISEAKHQALVFVQKVIRGRAAQTLIFEGRDKCRELICELRSTHALQDHDRDIKNQQQYDVKSQQREQQLELDSIDLLKEALSRLQGTVVGTLLDFLNKELRRLLDERKAHAFALLADRERRRREAAEAGRRQVEERRRREHDEMFRQIVKVHQDTIDLYLRDIITDGMERVSDVEAQNYVKSLVDKIDKESLEEKGYRRDSLEEEEIIANLIHHFVLPEVEKDAARRKMKLQQHKYLRHAHSLIYNEIERLPKHSLHDISHDKSKNTEIQDQGRPEISSSLEDVAYDVIDTVLDQVSNAVAVRDDETASDDEQYSTIDLKKLFGGLAEQSDISVRHSVFDASRTNSAHLGLDAGVSGLTLMVKTAGTELELPTVQSTRLDLPLDQTCTESFIPMYENTDGTHASKENLSDEKTDE